MRRALLAFAVLVSGPPPASAVIDPSLPPEAAAPLVLETTCPPEPARCTWARTFGSTFEDKLYALAPVGDGGALLAGSTRVNGVARPDGWVLRLDREGRRLWERRDGGADTEQFYGIVAAVDGGAFVAGHTRSVGAGESDLYIERLGARGERLWERTLGGPANDRARALAGTADGGVVAAGFTASSGHGGRDLWVVRLDGDGAVAWERRFGGPADDMAHAVAADGAGGAVVGGYTREADAARGFDFRVLRLDGDGGVVWEASLDRTPFDLVTAVVATEDGGAVAAGTSPDGRLDVRVVRFDGRGAVRWERVLGGPGAETAWGLARVGGGFVLAGSSGSGGAGSHDLWLVGLDEAGRVRFERRHGGALWDRATAVRALADGTLWVAGYTTSEGAGFEDGWVLRLDAEGRR